MLCATGQFKHNASRSLRWRHSARQRRNLPFRVPASSAYNANKIDVGVIITNTREGLNRIKYKSSGPNFERVCDELDWLRSTLTVPLWVIGLK